MARTERQKWLETLEIVTQKRPDEAEAEWVWVMEQLELGLEYFLAIYEAVRQGGWREAENPAGYIKAVARRERRREGPGGERRGARGLRGYQGLTADAEEITLGRSGGVEMDGERFTGEEMLDHLQYRAESGMPTREADGTWRSAAGCEFDHEGLLRGHGGKRKRRPGKDTLSEPGAFARYASRIERMRAEAGKDERDEPYINDAPESLPDWQAWAQEAGLSEWEKKAIEYKMSGVGWTAAMAAQPDDASRRALQAAWRKVERSGEGRLREATPTKEAGELPEMPKLPKNPN